MSAQVAEVLKKALAAFGQNGEHWTQGHAAKPEGPSPSDGKHFCICTAIAAIGKRSALYEQTVASVCAVLGINSSGIQILEWNDTHGRTWPEIKVAFEKAIAKEEAA